ncbi:MAG: alpha-2-macroglobulin family protein, partial [Desulfovibrionaceae bacterium]|nr:alpha-2-macroglobulin family protein [Desulfovibrionaceae bacterium]
EPQTLPLPEAFTDSNGLAGFALPLNMLRAGTMQGSILLEGFEAAGGRAVTRQLDALFSPLDVALGYKPEGEANNLNYVPHGTKASLHLLAVDNELKPVQVDKAILTLSGRRYVNSLVLDSRGEYRYDATPVDTELSRQTISIDGTGLHWTLPTGTPGDFLLTVKKADGAILAGIPFSVAGNRLAPPDEMTSASLAKGDLRLKLDKERYESGETVKLRLSAPYSGTGLITVERETVVAHAWFTADAGDSVQEIRIPADFEGRGYVNVSFARAFDSDAVYMKPHAYAVAPFTAGVKRRDMGLAIESPARVTPGGQVKVKLLSRMPGRVLLFAVDEGVLQLTDFATPDPLRELLSDRALDVETLQAFDLLMPDHARLRGRIPGFGGGMGNPGGLFLNPFKRRGEPPFAYWSEVVEVDEKGAELSFSVPEYLSGRIRIMAVGSAAPKNGIMAAGSAQSAVDVRGTLILKPLLPLAAAPGDGFEGALVVANTVEGSGTGAQVKVSMECGPELAFVNTQTSRTVTVDENGEAALRFRLRANDVLGEARVRFSAVMDKADKNTPVLRTQTLSVRPPTPRVRTEEKKALTASGDILVSRDPYPYGAQGSLSVSGVSTLALRSIMARLGIYPYGCTEQLISSALPHAALLGTPELREEALRSPKAAPGDMEKRSSLAIIRAIDAIRRCFVSGEGISMWPNGPSDDFVTAYAADFLLTLRENGAAAPEGLTVNVLNVLERITTRSPASIHDGRIKLYGAWVLLRDGRIMTQAVERIEQWYRENTKGWENDVASVLMADSFAMLRLGKRAQGRLPAAFSPGTGDAVLSDAVARALHATVVMRNFKERRGEIQMEG